MRRPRRALRGRQVVDPEDGVRQLSRRARAGFSSPTASASSTSRAPSPAKFSTRGGESSATSASSCASFRASRRSTSSRRPRRSPGLDRAAARERAASLLAAASPARTALGAAAGDVLGRRTAARQHRARLRGRPSPPHPRRADRLARRRQSRSGDRRSSPSARRWATGFLAIFHDEDVRLRVADRIVDVSRFSDREAA